MANFNVVYEIGFAIGSQKRTVLIKNKNIDSDDRTIKEVGIFDTLGYQEYNNGTDLRRHLSQFTASRPLDPITITSTRNNKVPIYLVDSPSQTQTMDIIHTRIKKTRIKYRSYNPAEDTRMSAIETIEHVATSHGVIVPLLNDGIRSSTVHNLRAAFVAGIAHGLGRPCLILQDETGPAPLDVRDSIKRYKQPGQINDHIANLALDVTASMQEIDPLDARERDLVAKLELGDPMAENELSTLGAYYLETDEYQRTRRGEINVVVGRKGSGKTALFAHLRNKLRNNRANIIIDLKPQSYQLKKLKDSILTYLSDGSQSHLITAFWEYILYLEIAYKILEKDEMTHVNNHHLYEIYNELYRAYRAGDHSEQGDFSERLANLSNKIVERFEAAGIKEGALSNNQITEIVYSHDIKELKEIIMRYLAVKGQTWILFDNLDKGWATAGISDADILIIRSLIDAAREVQKDLNRFDIELYSVVFIRNDVYQLLVRRSADFGKETRATLDWSDPDRLREMLRRRIITTDGIDSEADFESVWNLVFQSHIYGEESSQYILDRSLMRPRNFIKIVQLCRGAAINLGKTKIDESCIEKGIQNFSDDLLLDAGRELVDIDADYEDMLYGFIDEGPTFSYYDLEVLLTEGGEKQIDVNLAIERLLYYGFLGIAETEGGDYIYNNAYDMKKFQARIKKRGDSVRYILNPAFWPALGIASPEQSTHPRLL